MARSRGIFARSNRVGYGAILGVSDGSTMKWIAETPFTGVREKGTPRGVLVRVGVPRRSGRTAWACPVQITGVVKQRVLYGEGAVQVLRLAIEVVGSTLYSQRRQCLQ